MGYLGNQITTVFPTSISVDTATIATANISNQLTDANMASGSVLQVVQQVYSTTVNISSTSYTATGLTKAITPTSTSSKILVMVNASADAFQYGDASNSIYFEIKRGSTQIAEKTVNAYADQSPNGYYAIPVDGTMIFLDSPNTTSATTYTVNGKTANTNNSMTLRISVSSADSMLTLMEIAG